MNNPIPPPLTVRHLRKSFHGVQRVEDVTFTVGAGRIVGLLGPNGAGKTTSIRMLLGLVAADAGEALVLGKPYRALADPLRQIGAVLDAGGLHPGRTAREHLRISAAQGRFATQRVDEVLETVGLVADAGRRIRDYSLGMRQRVAIATALLGEPRILVLDEPANGLDPAGIHWLKQYLRIFADGGGSVLLSSHMLSDVARIADDVVIIAGGRVRSALSLDEALASSGGDLEQYYLSLTGTDERAPHAAR
jgi:ABC-2 type transport system ATP-binding protein